nr:hypothetical protein [Nocardioides alcanivorans]
MEVEGCRGDRADGDPFGLDQPEAGAEHGAQADHLGPVGCGEELREEHEDAERDVAGVPGAFLDDGQLLVLQPERAHRVGAVEGADHGLGALPLGDPFLPVARTGPGQVPPQAPGIEGRGEEPRQRQPPVERGETAEGEADQDHRVDQRRHEVADRVGHQAGVVTDAGEQVAGARGLERGGLHVERSIE